MRHSSLFLFLCLSFLSACATRKEIGNFKKDLFFLRTEVDSLRSGQQATQFMLRQLQVKTAQEVEANVQWRERLSVKLEQIAEQNQFLGGRLETLSQQLANLPTQLRLVASPGIASPPAANKFNRMDTATADQRPQFPGSVRLYESAYQDLIKGQHKRAREGFALYLRFLPQGELADEAQYWIGESYNGDGQMEEAIQAFQDLVDHYPESDRVPAALFKLANYQIALGQTNAGKKILETLIERFPQTKESNAAQLRLQELQN